MPANTNNRLEDVLRQQVDAAYDEAVRTGGEVPAERIEALARLARLVELRQGIRPAPRRQWGLALAAIGSTLLIVSALFFARVGETEVELEVELSEMSFVLLTPQVLTETMQLSLLGVSGLSEIEIPRARNRDAQTLTSFQGARFSVDAIGPRRGSINLTTSLLPAGTHVWVRHTDLPHQYRLSLKGTDTILRADVDEPVRVGFSTAGSDQLDFVTPQPIVLQAGAAELDLDLAFLDPATSVFSPQLSIGDLSLFHIDEVLETNRSLVRRLSTVLSGTIYFVSLNDEPHRLRPGESIQCERSAGELRLLRLKDDHIEAKFHGHVRGLTAGLDESRRTLMPTWLDWLRARHGLSLFWGTSLYLFGLIAAALRWLGKRV